MIAVYGQERLLAEVVALGFVASCVVSAKGIPFVVIPSYEIGLGRFGGRSIGLAFQATPDFPKTVASAIHVRADPQLYEPADSVPTVRNITASALGSEWRYWSHNFGWSGEKSAKVLMAQVNRVFLDA